MEFSAINLTQILTTLITTAGAIVCAVLGKKAEAGKSVKMEQEKGEVKKPVSIWAFECGRV